MTNFEEALAELKRVHWTALNIIYKDEDWTTKELVEHMENCPVKKFYEDLNKAVGKTLTEWHNVKQKLNDQSLDNLLKTL